MKHDKKIVLEIFLWIFIALLGAFVLYEPFMMTMGEELMVPTGMQQWQFGLLLIVLVAGGGIMWSFLLKKFKMRFVGWTFAFMLSLMIMELPSKFATQGVIPWSYQWFAISFITMLAFLFLFYGISVIQKLLVQGKHSPTYFWSNLVFVIAIIIMGLSVAKTLGPLIAFCFLVGASIYDAWAVWKSKTMEGLVVGLASHGVYPAIIVPKPKEKVGFALLGGGDVFFLIAVSFAFFATSWITTILTALGMIGALAFIFAISEKGKFYPALPFMLAGCIVGLCITAVIGVPIW